jgi:hypothetical protein
MLVLLGPEYEGRDDEVQALVEETGLTQYDLRARLCPGSWGVIRAFADEAQAESLVERLLDRGLPACSISATVGQDGARTVVYLREIRFEPSELVLRLSEREMSIPYGALLVVVRGEVHVGRSPHISTSSGHGTSMRPSSSSLALLSPSSSTGEYVRDPWTLAGQDVFAAADLHFATVSWIARIDARAFVFPREYLGDGHLAERLDHCIDDLARISGIRVDRALKTSSLASHTMGQQRAATPSPNGPASVRRGPNSSDDHFDAYSRLVGEAERLYLARTLRHSAIHANHPTNRA